MSRAGLLRLVLLGAAAACALIAFGILPAIPPPADLGRRPAVIVNNGGAAVVVVHCLHSCPAGGTTVAPGRQLLAGPPGARWRVADTSGVPLGCLTATTAGERLLVSKVTPCRP